MKTPVSVKNRHWCFVSYYMLNHPEVLQRLFNCLFLLRRALRLLDIFGLWLIVVLTLNDTAFLLYLCDIQAADLQAAMLQHIILNLLIGSFFLYISQIQLVQIQLHLDMLLGIEFGQKYNRLNVLQQISINFVIAIGMTFVIISGGIDLSVGSNIALSGLLMAIMMKTYNVNVGLTVALCILFSGLIGLVNGVMVAYLDLPPFIATLGMMSIARGAAYTVTGGQPVYTMPASFVAVSGRVAGIPLYAILIMAGVFFLGWYALRYTRAGRYTYAIGGNENCAKLSGINLGRTKCLVYTISGLCCGVAALLLTSRLDSAVPTNADGQEMDAIAAVVIGGTSMKGGEGSMIGTLIGIMIIGVISNGLNLLGVAQGPQRMVKGLIIVVAVIIDVVRRKAAEAAK